MAEESRFFLVWSPAGYRNPQARHADYAKATAEAERLAAQNPGTVFYVVCAISDEQLAPESMGLKGLE